MHSKTLINHILANKKITDYLAKKGIVPIGSTSVGRLKYRCPIHEGDNDPSFMVYTDSGPYENYFCFGCKSHNNIIHLYCALEKVSFGEALKILSDGLEIDINAELNESIKEIEQDHSVWQQYTPVQLSLLISRQIYDYKKRVSYDDKFIAPTEKILKTTDELLDKGDMAGLLKLFDILPEVLMEKVKEYDIDCENSIKEKL